MASTLPTSPRMRRSGAEARSGCAIVRSLSKKGERADLSRGVEAEQQLLDDLHKQTEAAHQQVDQLQQDIKSKQRDLADVEATIKERNVVLNQLNEGYNNLRRMLEAA